MKIKFVIYTQAVRLQLAQELRSQLSNCFIHIDNGSGHINAASDALERYYEPDCDYLVLLEDDIELCIGFEVSVRRALAANKDRCPVVFFGMSKEGLQAHNAGYRWIRMKTSAWAQCVAYPVYLIPRLLEFPKGGWRWSDNWLSVFCLDNGIDIMQPLPNFVQHKDIQSSVGNPKTIGGRRRISPVFGSGLGIDYENTYDLAYCSKISNRKEAYMKDFLKPPFKRPK